MEPTRGIGAEIDVLTSHVPLPGFGVLPVNSYLLHGTQPVLVDTGLITEQAAFVGELSRVIDPEDLRWIYLTHADADHVGSLRQLLELAPRARLVTTFLGAGKLGLTAPVPMERVFLLNPGQSLQAGDRKLTALRPPTFDAPETTAIFDEANGVLISSDCFGAILSGPVEDARDIPEGELESSQILWATIDAPWLADVRPEAFAAALHAVQALKPRIVLSSHLPPAPGMTDRLVDNLTKAVAAPTFMGPDQAALEAMMAQSGVGPEVRT